MDETGTRPGEDLAGGSGRHRDGAPRDAAAWAPRGTDLKVTYIPEGAVNLNVDGRRVAGPLQGFGPLWQKTYRMRLEGAAGWMLIAWF